MGEVFFWAKDFEGVGMGVSEVGVKGMLRMHSRCRAMSTWGMVQGFGSGFMVSDRLLQGFRFCWVGCLEG